MENIGLSKIVDDAFDRNLHKQNYIEKKPSLLFAHMFVRKELERRMELLDGKRKKRKGGAKILEDKRLDETSRKQQNDASQGCDSIIKSNATSKSGSKCRSPGSKKESIRNSDALVSRAQEKEFPERCGVIKEEDDGGGIPLFPLQEGQSGPIDIDIKEEEIEEFEFIPCKVAHSEEDLKDDQPSEEEDEEEEDDYDDSEDSAAPLTTSKVPTPELLQQLLLSNKSALSLGEVSPTGDHLSSQLLLNMAQHVTLLQVSKLMGNQPHPLDLRLTSKSGDESDHTVVSESDSPEESHLAGQKSALSDCPGNSPILNYPLMSQCASEAVISDEELLSLSVRELNKRLHLVPKSLQDELRRRRRTLKNRGYAQNCRTKRTQYQLQLKSVIKNLRKENNDTREEVSRLSQQIILYKSENTLLKDDIETLKLQLRTTLSELEQVRQQSNICHKCRSACPVESSEKEDKPTPTNVLFTSLSSGTTTED